MTDKSLHIECHSLHGDSLTFAIPWIVRVSEFVTLSKGKAERVHTGHTVILYGDPNGDPDHGPTLAHMGNVVVRESKAEVDALIEKAGWTITRKE